MPGESREEKETEAPEESDFGQVGVPRHRLVLRMMISPIRVMVREVIAMVVRTMVRVSIHIVSSISCRLSST
jgi:hypothetical protein